MSLSRTLGSHLFLCTVRALGGSRRPMLFVTAEEREVQTREEAMCFSSLSTATDLTESEVGKEITPDSKKQWSEKPEPNLPPSSPKRTYTCRDEQAGLPLKCPLRMGQ